MTKLLTAKDVAELLRISVRTVWRLVSTGAIPGPIKIGAATRWRADDIGAMIDLAPQGKQHG
jgi:excisionase family DNA binding protein